MIRQVGLALSVELAIGVGVSSRGRDAKAEPRGEIPAAEASPCTFIVFSALRQNCWRDLIDGGTARRCCLCTMRCDEAVSLLPAPLTALAEIKVDTTASYYGTIW